MEPTYIPYQIVRRTQYVDKVLKSYQNKNEALHGFNGMKALANHLELNGDLILYYVYEINGEPAKECVMSWSQ